MPKFYGRAEARQWLRADLMVEVPAEKLRGDICTRLDAVRAALLEAAEDPDTVWEPDADCPLEDVEVDVTYVRPAESTPSFDQ